MIWHDGQGDFVNVERLEDCPDCAGGKKRQRSEREEDTSAEMDRCTTCTLGELTCRACMKRRHARTPFHSIQVRFAKFSTMC